MHTKRNKNTARIHGHGPKQASLNAIHRSGREKKANLNEMKECGNTENHESQKRAWWVLGVNAYLYPKEKKGMQKEAQMSTDQTENCWYNMLAQRYDDGEKCPNLKIKMIHQHCWNQYQKEHIKCERWGRSLNTKYLWKSLNVAGYAQLSTSEQWQRKVWHQIIIATHQMNEIR
jgi:hypothetical protein